MLAGLLAGVRLNVLTPLGTLSSVPCSLVVVMQQQFTYMARREGLSRSGAKQRGPGCFCAWVVVAKPQQLLFKALGK
jgi:hypothetical protein